MTNLRSTGGLAHPEPPAVPSLGDARLSDGAPDYAIRLVNAVEHATPRLATMVDMDSAVHPAPGKWSPREIIGHLIDSASNNHQRFVRMRASDELVVDGYAQDEWVSAQRYQDAPWLELVSLWRLYNRQLARLMSVTPAEDRDRPRARHNLDQRAFISVPADQPTTLGYLMRDYVDHLEHHLRQILG
jgi:hypothetical protein